jgi:hypothetical protein
MAFEERIALREFKEDLCDRVPSKKRRLWQETLRCGISLPNRLVFSPGTLRGGQRTAALRTELVDL